MIRALLVLFLLSVSCGGQHAASRPGRELAPDTVVHNEGTDTAEHTKPLPTAVEYSFPASDTVLVALRDEDGEVLLAPTLRSSKTFGDTVLPAGIHLVKLQRNGDVRWSVALSENTEGHVSALQVDGAGHIYIAGTFARTLTGGDRALQSQGDWDAFVASFGSGGAPRWMRSLGGRARDVVLSLCLSEEFGRVAIGGWAESTFHFRGGRLSSRGSAKNGFLAVYDLQGEELWAKRLTGRGLTRVHTLAFDADALFVAGIFEDTLILDKRTEKSRGASDIFLVRYWADGEVDWSRAWGGPRADSVHAIAVGVDGQITLAGSSRGAIAIGGNEIPGKGERDVLLWRLGREGETEGSMHLGGPGDEVPTGLTLGAHGELQLLGAHTGDTNLGFEDITGSAEWRAFDLTIDSQLRVVRSARPNWRQLLRANGEGLTLAQDASGTKLRY